MGSMTNVTIAPAQYLLHLQHKRREEAMKLRDMETPIVLGYELDRNTLTPKRKCINVTNTGDYGADPLGNGMFRMVPSGDVVGFEERNRRLRQGGR